MRIKDDEMRNAIELMKGYMLKVNEVSAVSELMAYEGLSSKLYFKHHFDNVIWHGRQPRIKRDYVNSSLDIGYTMLFSFVDALLSSYGFDT